MGLFFILFQILFFFSITLKKYINSCLLLPLLLLLLHLSLSVLHSEEIYIFANDAMQRQQERYTIYSLLFCFFFSCEEGKHKENFLNIVTVIVQYVQKSVFKRIEQCVIKVGILFLYMVTYWHYINNNLLHSSLN